ncbi:MAG: zinc ribbon domain-containing protein, partial [Actinomycetota bacterium]|nr:zinc ribbon domain-containing protein [Actinomycetota bacterium]
MSDERRFCENCGTQVGETTNFCPNCGAAQRPDPEVPAGPPPPTPEAGSIPTPDAPDVPPPPPQAGTRNWGRIALGGCGVLVLLFVLAVACAVLVGRGTSEGGGTKSTETPSKEQEEKKQSDSAQKKGASPAEEPAPITLSGNGQAASDPFELESGLAIFRLTHQGGGHFSGTLLDSDGQRAGGMD